MTSLIPMITPMYLEKTANPLEFSQGKGFQTYGVNTQFDSNSGLGALSLRGGLFYSRALGPRQIINNTDPLPDNRFGQQTEYGNMRSFGVPQGMLFGNGMGRGATDNVTYQRMSYQANGLNLGFNYGQVGKNFQGINELKQSMAPGDPQGAGLLDLGMTRSNFSASYTGVKGLEVSHTTNNLVNEQQGNKEYGLKRTEQENKLVYNFGDRRSFTYRLYSKDESWDPSLVKKDGSGLQQQQFGVQYGLGAKSLFSLNQTTTSQTAGTKETDIRESSLGFSWKEWEQFSFDGGYATKQTAQTDESNRILNLAIATTLVPNVQINGKLVQNETTRPGAAVVKNNTADLNLVAQLSPSLKISSLYQDLDTVEKGQVTTQDQQVAWTINPRWSLASRLLNTDSSKTGSLDRLEHRLTGQLGTKDRAEQVNLFTRTDTLSGDTQQTRREVNYTRALGTKEAPVSLRVQLGQYDFTQKDVSKDGNLLTVQLLTLRPLPRTTVSLGYYDGPMLGASYLAYRGWGQKPSGNLETWNTAGFTPYRETGAEMTYALTGSTKVVVKQLFGEREDTGRVDTQEYGIEQQLGPVKLLAGRRNTAQPGDAPKLEENWWQLQWTDGKALPAWAVNSTRQVVFSDSAKWGLAQPAAWVTAPAAGLTLERRDEKTVGNGADVYTARYSRMVGSRLFLQSSYERDPRKADKPNEVDHMERELVHVGYAVRPELLAYARYLRENRLDVQPDLLTRSVGVVGTLSKNEKLHVQVDLLTRTTKDKEEAGAGYMVGYERTLSPENTLSLKYRYLPEEFTTPENQVRLEASLQRAF
ncbi:MAG: hypothetical protein ACYDCO_10380 [Armatimonadota bacterium]